MTAEEDHTDTTPSTEFIKEWEGMSIPYKRPVRLVPGLGGAVLGRTEVDNIVILSSIYAKPVKQGLGTKLLKMITGLADKHKIVLEVSPIRNKPHLLLWYKKHGFTEVTPDGYALSRPCSVENDDG